jgi:hypothetical protein
MGFNVFERLFKAHRRSAVRTHERVRLVAMDGCMAHVRGQVQEGMVTDIIVKQVYGDTHMRPWASIRLDEGTTVERCAELNNWTRHEDGTMEYRY